MLITLSLGGLRTALGQVSAWVDLVAVVTLVLAYPSAVRTLGLAPDAWEE